MTPQQLLWLISRIRTLEAALEDIYEWSKTIEPGQRIRRIARKALEGEE